MSSARPTEGSAGPRRVRKNKLRVRKEEEGWQLPELPPQLLGRPYENKEGYIVEPWHFGWRHKLLAASLGVALILAALNPPPFIPRSYLYEGFLGNGHRDLVTTAAGQTKFWSDLTGKEKTAAELLGFDQQTWDEDGKVPVDKKTWKQLTPVQQRAAAVLSIDQSLWDEEVYVDIYERAWSELTPVQKDSAKLLGFDKTSWDEEKHVWSDDLYWRQLTLPQQGAAIELGYAAEEWDSTRKVFDKSWDTLTQDQKDAATLLGWNVKKWEKDKYVRVDDLYWRQLSEEQRKAARTLGFKQTDWDKATKAGSHSKDMETQRKRKIREKAVERNRQKKECQSHLLGPFSFARCGRKSVPYYVPTILQHSSERATFPFGMGELK